MATATEFLVDTTLLVAHIRQKQSALLPKAVLRYGRPAVSAMVVFELEVGGIEAGRHLEFFNFFGTIHIYPLDNDVLLQAAEIHVALKRKNQVIGLADTMIAATARVHQLPLLTLNTKHFQRVAGIQLLPIPT